jgi:hypothetical protein
VRNVGRVTPRPSLFVNYRRTQFDRVQPVVTALRNVGIECFFDVENIDPLADFPERIRMGIDRSHALLAWWSADYGESDFCLQEFRRAWQHARRHTSDLARRIWIVNPERTVRHIFAGELNSNNFLNPPTADNEADWVDHLLSLAKLAYKSRVLAGPSSCVGGMSSLYESLGREPPENCAQWGGA